MTRCPSLLTVLVSPLTLLTLVIVAMQACVRPRDARMLRGWRDAKALSIPIARDAKLNELPKQIFMLLPLLLQLLFLLYVL